MPNTINSSSSSKAARNGYTANTGAHLSPSPDQMHSQMRSTTDARRTPSASSSDSQPDREAAYELLQEIAPDIPANQHALNDMSGLHSRMAANSTGLASTELPIARERRVASRRSSWGSSRAASAVPISDSIVPETDGGQLTLQGVSIA